MSQGQRSGETRGMQLSAFAAARLAQQFQRQPLVTGPLPFAVQVHILLAGAEPAVTHDGEGIGSDSVVAPTDRRGDCITGIEIEIDKGLEVCAAYSELHEPWRANFKCESAAQKASAGHLEHGCQGDIDLRQRLPARLGARTRLAAEIAITVRPQPHARVLAATAQIEVCTVCAAAPLDKMAAESDREFSGLARRKGGEST